MTKSEKNITARWKVWRTKANNGLYGDGFKSPRPTKNKKGVQGRLFSYLQFKPPQHKAPAPEQS